AQQSSAGGVHNALLTAARLGCETVQMFTKNTNQWAARPLSPLDIDLFRKALRQTRLRFPTAHDSYLINLASPNPGLWLKSVEAFVGGLDRAPAVGLKDRVSPPCA